MRRRTVPAFPIALALTVGLALMPMKVLRALEDVAAIVNLPLTPLRDGANLLAHWLRPPPSAADLIDPDASLEQLDRERRRWRQKYEAAMLRVSELEEQLVQIQQLPITDFGVEVKPVTARVTGRNPRSAARVVELNRGGRDGIREGSIAVYNGVYLIGQVASVSTVRSVLVPITSPESGLLRGRVMKGTGPIAEQPVIQLRPEGSVFRAEAAREKGVGVGDVVVLDDSAWPRTAQAMIIGSVESAAPKEDQPLRDVLEIRPPFPLHGLASVTLIVELEPEERILAEGAAP